MRINTLHLKTFRTYKNQKIELHPRLTFIYGPNASGKTNILEAVSILAFGKSFRGAQEKDMVQNGEQGYHLSCSYEKNSEKFVLSCGCDPFHGKVQRKIKLDETPLLGRQSLISQIVCVFFSPSDISIVDGGPSFRRRFLDTVLSYQNKNYLQDLINFNKSLRQRNVVLKKFGNSYDKDKEGILEAWDQNLIQCAERITKARIKFIQEFQDVFYKVLSDISETRDDIKIKLKLSHIEEEENYKKILRENYEQDSNFGSTSVGPHRQNLLFEKEGKDILRFGSQGQKRSLVLSLRIAQFFFLKKSLNLTPVLLIDDVIGELDKKRKKAFVRVLHESSQTVFTSPEVHDLDGQIAEIAGNSIYYQVSSPGMISREK